MRFCKSKSSYHRYEIILSSTLAKCKDIHFKATLFCVYQDTMRLRFYENTFSIKNNKWIGFKKKKIMHHANVFDGTKVTLINYCYGRNNVKGILKSQMIFLIF